VNRDICSAEGLNLFISILPPQDNIFALNSSNDKVSITFNDTNSSTSFGATSLNEDGDEDDNDEDEEVEDDVEDNNDDKGVKEEKGAPSLKIFKSKI
jgi:hypothetical protein